MRRRVFHAEHPAPRINVTPMIDVVMVLIIFFLIVGKLAAERLAEVDLPEASAASAPDQGTPLVINVVPDDDESEGSVTIIIESVTLDPVGVEQVVRETLAQEPGRMIQIRASRRLSYGAVRPVIAACRRAGVSSLLLATTGASPAPSDPP